MWTVWLILAIFIGIGVAGAWAKTADDKDKREEAINLVNPRLRKTITEDIIQMKHSTEFKSVMDRLLPLLDRIITDAKENGKELVGEEYSYLTVMVSDKTLKITTRINKGKRPNPGDEHYDSVSTRYFLESCVLGDVIQYTDCGFDAVSKASMAAFKVALKEELERRKPELPYLQAFEYQMTSHHSATILAYNLTQFHKKRNFKTI